MSSLLPPVPRGLSIEGSLPTRVCGDTRRRQGALHAAWGKPGQPKPAPGALRLPRLRSTLGRGLCRRAGASSRNRHAGRRPHPQSLAASRPAASPVLCDAVCIGAAVPARALVPLHLLGARLAHIGGHAGVAAARAVLRSGGRVRGAGFSPVRRREGAWGREAPVQAGVEACWSLLEWGTPLVMWGARGASRQSLVTTCGGARGPGLAQRGGRRREAAARSRDHVPHVPCRTQRRRCAHARGHVPARRAGRSCAGRPAPCMGFPGARRPRLCTLGCANGQVAQSWL